MTVGHSDTQPTEEESREIGGVKVMTSVVLVLGLYF